MAYGRTLQRRKRQAELIQRWKPWKQSIGPKTEVGKRQVSRNTCKGGWRAQFAGLRRMLREQAQGLRRQVGS